MPICVALELRWKVTLYITFPPSLAHRGQGSRKRPLVPAAWHPGGSDGTGHNDA